MAVQGADRITVQAVQVQDLHTDRAVHPLHHTKVHIHQAPILHHHLLHLLHLPRHHRIHPHLLRHQAALQKHIHLLNIRIPAEETRFQL